MKEKQCLTCRPKTKGRARINAVALNANLADATALASLMDPGKEPDGHFQQHPPLQAHRQAPPEVARICAVPSVTKCQVADAPMMLYADARRLLVHLSNTKHCYTCNDVKLSLNCVSRIHVISTQCTEQVWELSCHELLTSYWQHERDPRCGCNIYIQVPTSCKPRRGSDLISTSPRSPT